MLKKMMGLFKINREVRANGDSNIEVNTTPEPWSMPEQLEPVAKENSPDLDRFFELNFSIEGDDIVTGIRLDSMSDESIEKVGIFFGRLYSINMLNDTFALLKEELDKIDGSLFIRICKIALSVADEASRSRDAIGSEELVITPSEFFQDE